MLERTNTSDALVGKISRYIGWVRKHIAAGRSVSGLILAQEIDENLQYAVLANSVLSLKHYKLNLEILDEDDLQSF